MIDIKNGLLVGLMTFGLIGCSDPEPIDLETAVNDAGISDDGYTVNDNGSIEIESQVEDALSYNPNDPVATHGDNWQYVVSNGIRTADEYAVKNNPAATFIGNDVQANLNEQIAGEYEGDYLLTILNDNPGNINYAQLRPLFDMHSSSDTLDDESKLWEVTIAKHNGRKF